MSEEGFAVFRFEDHPEPRWRLTGAKMHNSSFHTAAAPANLHIANHVCSQEENGGEFCPPPSSAKPRSGSCGEIMNSFVASLMAGQAFGGNDATGCATSIYGL